MAVCGSCGGVIGSDFWSGTTCACVSPSVRLGAALHEALLNSWPFTYLADRQPVTVVYSAAEALGITPRALQAVMDVERTPWPPGVVMLIGADEGFEWPEFDIRKLVQDTMEEAMRPRSAEELRANRELYERRLADAYTKDFRLTLKDMGPAEFDRLYKCEPLPEPPRYGPHATDPYAPGSRRRRR